ncbi:AraC family transcriptional regulator [Lentimicrobium sp. S6]|uniref:helix-turn-helix domain-containing protein n=1 Tax=Lentimicrobium sp. S6 TaxID=2735872 RepID=UPI0015523D0F|nr:helix-turn-helix transcriptional regulator [Lentimicrobium sp. S6]NPD47473.1 AraC family transcriptional regulator [Lentimicrobium sp. S6]
MQIILDIFTISNLISIIVGLFLGIHFLVLNGNRKNINQYLGLFLLLTSFSVLGNEFEHNQYNQVWTQLITIVASPFIFAPILLNYTFALTNNYDVKAKKYRWLFLFPIVDILLTIVFEFNIVEYTNTIDNILTITDISSIVFSSMIFVLALREIKHHNNNILNLFSSIENKRLNWLRLLLIVNIGFLIIWFTDDSLMFFIGDNMLSDVLAVFSHFTTLITILWIGFSALRQEDTFIINKKEKTTSFKLNNNSTQKFEEIKNSIESDRIYTNPNLSLLELANQVGVNPKELTQLINECSGTNFYYFINKYRIQYFKDLLVNSNNKHISIEGLSQEAGFRSKSTFYSAFKKTEGITPKEYELKQK